MRKGFDLLSIVVLILMIGFICSGCTKEDNVSGGLRTVPNGALNGDHLSKEGRANLPHTAVFIEGSIYDQGWNSKAYDAITRMEEMYETEVDYVELHNDTSFARIAQSVENCSKKGARVFIGHGEVFGEPFLKLSASYPAAQFVVINSDVSGERLISIHFSGYTTGFLAGALAALMSEKGDVGIVSAYPEQSEIAGFLRGAQFMRPKIQVRSFAAGSWDNREGGRKAAQTLIAEGSDVIFPAGDGFAIEVLDEARRSGIYAVGFILDQSFVARNTVLASVMQNVEDVYLTIADHLSRGTINEMQGMVFDVKNGGQVLSSFGPMVPKTVQEKMQRLYRALKEGYLTEAQLKEDPYLKNDAYFEQGSRKQS